MKVRPRPKLAGLTVVAEERFEQGTTDFYSVLTRILSKSPDMIDTTVAAGDEPALITKQARETGFQGHHICGDADRSGRLCEKPRAPNMRKAHIMAGPGGRLHHRHAKNVFMQLYKDKIRQGRMESRCL